MGRWLTWEPRPPVSSSEATVREEPAGLPFPRSTHRPTLTGEHEALERDPSYRGLLSKEVLGTRLSPEPCSPAGQPLPGPRRTADLPTQGRLPGSCPGPAPPPFPLGLEAPSCLQMAGARAAGPRSRCHAWPEPRVQPVGTALPSLPRSPAPEDTAPPIASTSRNHGHTGSAGHLRVYAHVFHVHAAGRARRPHPPRVDAERTWALEDGRPGFEPRPNPQ